MKRIFTCAVVSLCAALGCTHSVQASMGGSPWAVVAKILEDKIVAASALSTDGRLLVNVTCSHLGEWTIWLESASAAYADEMFQIGAGNVYSTTITVDGRSVMLEPTLGMTGTGTASLNFNNQEEDLALAALYGAETVMTIDLGSDRLTFGMVNYREIRSLMYQFCK